MIQTLLSCRVASLAVAVSLAGLSAALPVLAQDGTWLLNGTGDFGTAANWSSNAVPTGIATFGASNQTTVAINSDTPIGQFSFTSEATAYSFLLSNSLVFTDSGIVSQSSNQPAFTNNYYLGFYSTSAAANASITNNGYVEFANAGTAANAAIMNRGALFFYDTSSAANAAITNDGRLGFSDTSTAANAAIWNNGLLAFSSNSTAASAALTNVGRLTFSDNSTAADATITNDGRLVFSNKSSAANATITNDGRLTFSDNSTAAGATITNDGRLVFSNKSSAANATITNDGRLTFSDNSTADDATITNNERLVFSDRSTAANAAITNTEGGRFDISALSRGGTTVGSIAGAGRFELGSKTLTVGSNNQSTTVSGSIKDGRSGGGTGGSLVKTGTGTLVLSGMNGYTGSTTVKAGTLSVNGSTASSVLTTVNAGGTLGGTGTVGTTRINRGGTLAPGNPIGTLTVQGNLTFGARSTYAVEVSTSGADRTNVTGMAALAGTLQSSFAPGTGYARTYTLLSATGGRTGTFATFNTAGLPGGFQTNLSYTPTDLILNLTAALGGGMALSSNQGNVANALNTSFNSGNSLPSGLYGLFSMSGPPLANALNSLSGEAQTGAQTAAFTFGNQFLNTVLGRTGSSGPGGNWQQAVQYASLDANEAGPEPRRLRAWLAGFGGYGWLDGAAGSTAVQTTTQGLAMGADWTFDGGTLGVAVASGSSNWFLGGGLGSGLGNVLQVGLYGRTGAGPLYAAVAGGWGVHGVSTNRSVGFLGDIMSANYTVNTWSGRAEAGYRIALGDHGLTPFVAGQVQAANLPGFCETSQTGSGAALCFNANTATSVRSELGIEGDANLGRVLGSKARLQARLAWAHEYETTGTATAWFQSLPLSSFSVSGTPLPADVGLVRVLSEIELNGTWSLRLQGDAEFAGNYGLLAGTARIAARW